MEDERQQRGHDSATVLGAKEPQIPQISTARFMLTLRHAPRVTQQ
jgi:hypothetical protein